MSAQKPHRDNRAFGPFEVDLEAQELKKNGVRLALPRQSFRILTILLENSGRLVAREELQKALWPADTFVDFEKGLNAAINRLRDVLGDSAEKPRYVETLPRRGYRFIARVSEARETEEQETKVNVEIETATASVIPARRWTLLAVLGACVAVVLVWVVHRSHRAWEAESSPPIISQISHWNKPMEWVRLSPDGHAVTFTSPVSEVQQVFLMLTSGGMPLQLTTEPGDKILNNFSADGTEIYYLQGNDEAWAVPSLGGKPRRLLSGDVGYIVPSPDGASLFYTRNDNTGIYRADKSGANEELIYKADDSSEQLAVIGVFPDGNHLLIGYWHVDSNPAGGLANLNLTTRRYVDLGIFLKDSIDVSWDKPGRSILFSRRMNGLRNLWSYDLQDFRATQITFGTGPDSWPFRDPEGRGIFYVNGKSAGHLTAYAIQSKRMTDIVSDDSNQPAISPDGKHVMYITDLSPSEDELWVSDIGGRNKVRIAAGESTGTGGWAPDSFHLCFVKAGSTYVAGADGSGLRKLTRTQQNCIWSSDQKALFISTEGKVGVTDTWKWNLELPGENETKIADNCGVVSDADPSGRYLLTDGILTAATGRGISEISLSDGKCTALLPDVFTWTTIFAPDGKSFLYAVSALDGTIIYRQRWKDGKLVGSPSVEVKVPINLSGFLGDSYSFSSDLSTMIYARPDRRADLYLMSLR